jgi:hypothetical protein
VAVATVVVAAVAAKKAAKAATRQFFENAARWS